MVLICDGYINLLGAGSTLLHCNSAVVMIVIVVTAGYKYLYTGTPRYRNTPRHVPRPHYRVAECLLADLSLRAVWEHHVRSLARFKPVVGVWLGFQLT